MHYCVTVVASSAKCYFGGIVARMPLSRLVSCWKPAVDRSRYSQNVGAFSTVLNYNLSNSFYVIPINVTVHCPLAAGGRVRGCPAAADTGGRQPECPSGGAGEDP